jgi:hypothetical protein
VKDASLLYEVPNQERDERCQSNNHEKWSPGDSRDMSRMWHKDVPNWKGITLITASGFNMGWIFVKSSALFDYPRHQYVSSDTINRPIANDLPISGLGI